MAKQTFTTGQVLTAAQMTSLQQTAMGGGAASTKTASYVLVAADAGTTVAMNAAGATTITVNTGLFSAGDTVFIQNIGAGATTITAGTATVNTAGSLILPQYDAGILYFTSASAAIFYDYIQVGATGPTGWNLLNAGGTALTGAATITVSGLSAKELLVIIIGASSANTTSNISLRLNADSGANYTWAGFYINAASAYSSGNRQGDGLYSGDTSFLFGRMADAAGAGSAVFGSAYLDLADTTGWKRVDIVGGGDSSAQQILTTRQGIYEASAAITSISIISSTGNFDAGTVYVMGAS